MDTLNLTETIKYAIDAENNILEFLASRYLEEHPVSSQEIKSIEKEMAPYYENAPFEASCQLFQTVYDLCSHYENTAFREGLRVGLQLAKELS